MLFVVNLMRGSSKNPSLINIKKCGLIDCLIFTSFIAFNITVTYLQVTRVQREQNIMIHTHIGISNSDILYTGSSLLKIVLASIGGGLAGAVGLGGGVVFNPVLIGMGVPPQVAAATGMYMIMFSAFSNSLTFWLFGNLNVMYALWIGFWSGMGIFIFLSLVGAVIKKYKRPSIVVFFLGGVIALSSVMVPTMNTTFLIQAAKNGKNIWGFG